MDVLKKICLNRKRVEKLGNTAIATRCLSYENRNYRKVIAFIGVPLRIVRFLNILSENPKIFFLNR